jgi:hypothetical protein
MGTSERWLIPHVLDVVVDEAPKTVLDVGAGWGKYAVLVREFSAIDRVDGLDIGPPRHGGYDHFYIGDVRDLGHVLPADAPLYDLALFLEVIEHLEKPDGYRALERLTQVARRVVVSTPLGFREQDTPHLPFEIHRSGWYPWEFGRRFKVHKLKLLATRRRRYLRLPSTWQILAVVSAKDPPPARPAGGG